MTNRFGVGLGAAPHPSKENQMTDWRNVGRDTALAVNIRDMVGTDDSDNSQATTNVASAV